jgi:transposase
MYYVGVDVSKRKLDLCLLVNPNPKKYKSKAIENSLSGVENMINWLINQSINIVDVHVIMEATGIYHERVAIALHEAGISVSIVNPAQVKSFARANGVLTKTDGVDSRLLADYGALMCPSIWQAPSAEARILKGLLARRESVKNDLQREENRMEQAKIAQESDFIQLSIRKSIRFLKEELKNIEAEVSAHIDQHPTLKQERELLESIPAIGAQTSAQMLSITHNNQFHSAEQLAAYLGLTPIEKQSGSSVRGRARLSKTGSPKMRAVLYMAAITAIKYNYHVKSLYERLLAKGKTKMSALGAAMRKLVHLCFGVLKTRQKYQADYQNA